MAAEYATLTLEDIDAIIDSSPASQALFVQHWEWFVIREAKRDLSIRNNGGLRYRGHDIWIGRATRMATLAESTWLNEL